jgi:hypothetical protein
MAMTLLDTVHSALREIFIAPAVGAWRAQQIGVPVSCLLVFAVTWISWRWLRAPLRRQQYGIGGLWVLLTVVLAFSIGRAAGTSWTQLLSYYNPARGGAMVLTLGFMFIAPRLVARFKSREKST